jgi:hypothetical protein
VLQSYFMHYHIKPYKISDSVLLIFENHVFARIVAVYQHSLIISIT